MKYPIMQSNRKPLLDAQEYESMYEQSMSSPDEFWANQAEQFISWDRKWDKVSEVDFLIGKIAWFEGATLNVSYNCLDRHLPERADQVAITMHMDVALPPHTFAMLMPLSVAIRVGSMMFGYWSSLSVLPRPIIFQSVMPQKRTSPSLGPSSAIVFRRSTREWGRLVCRREGSASDHQSLFQTLL